jgi:hypothetical protein
MTVSYPIPPRNLPDDLPSWLRQVANAVISLFDGKSNNTGLVTLRASQTTTTLDDQRITAQSFIEFMPLTANARAAKANLYVSAQGKQTATLTHASNAAVDQDFRYVVVGWSR